MPTLKLYEDNNIAPSEDAIPQSSPNFISTRKERCETREIRKRALCSVDSISPKKYRLEKEVMTEPDVEMDKKIKLLEKKVTWLQHQNQRLQRNLLLMKIKNRNIVRQFREKNSVKENYKLKNEVRKVLGKVFTNKQIQCLIQDKKRCKWSKEDIGRALALRAVSRKCYIYLRNKIGIPLPSLTTLKRWIANSFSCKPGILHDVLRLMHAKTKQMKPEDMLCVLSFDEMNVDSRIEYDQGEDVLRGPHSQAQAVMVRGLCAPWKQPVYFEFDKQMTGTLLKQIISAIQAVGYQIVAVVADMGGKNARVWKDLGVTHLNSCFPNPTYLRKRIWVFADIPHLLKLLSNHFLDDGFTLPDGEEIGKHIVEKLLSLDNGEMKICPRLSHLHLTVSGRDRQRVYLAAQLFSNHSAKAIRYLLPNKEKAASFFEITNDMFDVMNSRMPDNENTPLASGLGKQEKLQKKVLCDFYRICEKMKVGKHQKLLPFQKGFMTSIRSVLGCFTDLQKQNVKYILTSRLNQDCLENLFSQIRGLGHFYDHPLPADFKHRLKLLIVGTNISDIAMTSSSPVELENDCNSYITSELFTGLLPSMETALSMMDGDIELCDLEWEDTPTSVEVHSSSLQQGESLVEATDCSVEGFRFLAGYIAFRGRSIDRTLATPSEQVMSRPEFKAHDGWIEALSRGGLLVPSAEWLAKLKEWEILFSSFHGSTVSKEPNVIKKFCSMILEKYPEMNEKIVKVYARTRTFIRIRKLNAAAKAHKLAEQQQRKLKKWQASAVVK